MQRTTGIGGGRVGSVPHSNQYPRETGQSEATEITRDWLESIAFTFDPENLLLLQLSPQGEIVRRYVLRNTVPIYWSITLEPANKLAIETLVLYCAAGVQIDDD